MHAIYLLSVFPLTALAALNGHCTGPQATGYWGEYGICIETSTCDSYHGAYTDGACPWDPDSIKCCVVGVGGSGTIDPCGGSSECQWTNMHCDDKFMPGHCPGGSNYECCQND